MEKLKKKKWTIFFLIKSIDGTINDVISLINELRSTRLNNGISIVLCFHVAEEHLGGIESGNAVAVDAGNLSQNHVTAFYRIEKVPGEKMANGLTPEYKVRTKDFEITDPAHLEAFFRDCIVKSHAAERYMLFTWGHGSSYGIFKQLAWTNDDAEQHFLPQRLRNLPLDVATGSLMVPSLSATDAAGRVMALPEPEVEAKFLTIEALRDAIAASFGSQKIDVVAMMNCYMQFFDAGYALAKVARYLVAPETYMYFNGYHYAAIFRALSGNPAISPRKLSALMVQSFECKVIADEERNRQVKDNTALFANNLSGYPAMAASIGEFLTGLKLKTGRTKQVIVEARRLCVPLNSGTQVIDFGNLLFHLQHKLTGKDLSRLNGLLAAMKKIVVAKYAGSLFDAQNKVLLPSGFSVFFPLVEEGVMINLEGLGSYEKTEFFSNTKTGWGAFISQFREV